MPLVLITTGSTYRNRFLVTSLFMGDELRSAVDIDRVLVFRTVYTNFYLDRERRFLQPPYRFLAKNVAKNRIFLRLLGYLGEIESDSQAIWTCLCLSH